MQNIIFIFFFLLSIWAVLPILFLIVLSFLATILSRKKLKIIRIVKIALGLGNLSDNGIWRQVSTFDCGKAALINIFNDMGIIVNNLTLPEPASVKDIINKAVEFGCLASYYEVQKLEQIREYMQKETKVLSLLKIYYPFEGLWVRPTKILLKLIVNKDNIYHWVVIEKIEAKYVYLLDPYFGKIRLTICSFLDCWTKKVVFISK